VKIDLHIHSKNGSDGRWSLEDIFAEAHRRKIELMAITDHDSISAQEEAMRLAASYRIRYLTGVELNVTHSHRDYTDGKAHALDFLGYGINITNGALIKKLDELRTYRQVRAEKILKNINEELSRQGLPEFTQADMDEIQASVDGAFGRPHIAAYMIAKGIVADRQEAFDKYLVQCNVEKMPLSLQEASDLVRASGGKLILAHPNDPNGTSLKAFTPSIENQQAIITDTMLEYIDGIECWHSRHDRATMESYLRFAREKALMMTGGSDCHQSPLLLGSVDVPDFVARQFGF